MVFGDLEIVHQLPIRGSSDLTDLEPAVAQGDETIAGLQVGGGDPAFALHLEGVLGGEAKGFNGAVFGLQVELEDGLVGGAEELFDGLQTLLAGGFVTGPNLVADGDVFDGSQALLGGDESAGDEAVFGFNASGFAQGTLGLGGGSGEEPGRPRPGDGAMAWDDAAQGSGRGAGSLGQAR